MDHAHYSKTSDPILDKAVHPTTGLNWDMMIKIAIRGNTKGRRMPEGLNPDRESNKEKWNSRKVKYDKELAETTN